MLSIYRDGDDGCFESDLFGSARGDMWYDIPEIGKKSPFFGYDEIISVKLIDKNIRFCVFEVKTQVHRYNAAYEGYTETNYAICDIWKDVLRVADIDDEDMLEYLQNNLRDIYTPEQIETMARAITEF